jgi:hypothetical protein
VGFLRQELKDTGMELLSSYLAELEQYPSLDISIIRETKIRTVLKRILGLKVIPMENEYGFKARCERLLANWPKSSVVDSPRSG